MGELQYLHNVAKYGDAIRTGAVAFDYRTGQCGPAPVTQTKSWGAACPPGYCPPENLPPALGRWFAGDRAGCRELPYTVAFTGVRDAAANVAVTVSRTSTITMCPTRLLAISTDAVVPPQWTINLIQFGNQNQIVGGPVHFSAFGRDAFQAVPMVPDCIRAGLPYTMTVTLLPDAAVGTHTLSLVFIGPAVG